MARKKICDLCSACNNYPAICGACHSPEKRYHPSSKNNNYYVELEFMLLNEKDEEIREKITNRISGDYFKAIMKNGDVNTIHYRDPLSNLCFRIFHTEYERSIKKEPPKREVLVEYKIAYTIAKAHLEITIINMINNARKNIKKKRRT